MFKSNSNQRSKDINKLKHIIAKHDNLSILVGMLKFSLENKQDDFCFAICDYLIGMSMRYSGVITNKPITYKELNRIIDLSKSIIASYTFEGIDVENPHELPDEIKKSIMHKALMRTKFLLHRGDGYQIQLIDFANQLWGPMKDDMIECFGFSIETYMKMLIAYFNETVRIIFSHNLLSNRFIDENTVITQSFKSFNYFCVPITKFEEKFGTNEVRAILRKMSQKIECRIRVGEPIEFNDIVSRPIIVTDDSIIIPTIHSALMNIHKQFHYDFISTRPNIEDKKRDLEIKEKYKKLRGDLIESKVLNSIKKFREINAYHSLIYYEKDKRYEADVTVQYNDTTVLFECKGKLLTLNSLKGNIDSIRDDYSKMITYAYDQAERTEERIKRGESFLSGNADIKLPKTDRYFKIPIIADHMGLVSTSDRSFFGNSNSSPLPINIYDFEMICEQIQDFSVFIEYLVYRERFYDQLVTTDELEAFNYYLEGNRPQSGPNTRTAVIGFTESLDLKMQDKFNQFIRHYSL